MLEGWLTTVLSFGKGSLIVYHLYADESFEDAKGVFTVAGYLITSKALARLTEAWADALGPLDYFHMSEGHHKRYPDVYRKLVELMTHDYLIAGFCASVDQAEYKGVMGQQLQGQPMSYWFGGAYSFCVGAIAQLANSWLDARNPNERDVAYVFEAGYEKQGEADTFLQMINTEPALSERRRKLRYFSHTFMGGKRRESGALQAADILAWHITDGRRRSAFDDVGQKIVEEVELYSAHYPESGLRETLRNQLHFCDFYWDLKHAKRIVPR